MKSHKLLYQLKNKLTWLPILILPAFQNKIIYNSYAPVPFDFSLKHISDPTGQAKTRNAVFGWKKITEKQNTPVDRCYIKGITGL